jgi:hypothetical protein
MKKKIIVLHKKEISKKPVFVLNTEENDDWMKKLPGYQNEIDIIEQNQVNHDKSHQNHS